MNNYKEEKIGLRSLNGRALQVNMTWSQVNVINIPTPDHIPSRVSFVLHLLVPRSFGPLSPYFSLLFSISLSASLSISPSHFLCVLDFFTLNLLPSLES